MSVPELVEGSKGLIGRDQIYSRVDDYSAKHHEGGEASLVKGEVRESEHQEQSDERDRDHEYHWQWIPERLEGHGEHDIDHGDDQEYQPRVSFLVIVEPASRWILGLETDGKYLIIKVIHNLCPQSSGELIASDEIVTDLKGV